MIPPALHAHTVATTIPSRCARFGRAKVGPPPGIAWPRGDTTHIPKLARIIGAMARLTFLKPTRVWEVATYHALCPSSFCIGSGYSPSHNLCLPCAGVCWAWREVDTANEPRNQLRTLSSDVFAAPESNTMLLSPESTSISP